MSDKIAVSLVAEGDAKKHAKETLNETDETRTSGLHDIKKWLTEEKTNLHARLEDQYILPFLRGCKFDLKKTKAKLKRFYKMRRDVPEWFRNRDPSLPELQELMKLGCFVPLRRFHENKLVVIVRVAVHNPRRHQQNDVFKLGNMLTDVAAMEYAVAAQIYGVVAIFDIAGITLGHASAMTPSIITKAVHSWQNYHCRPKNLEFINAPTTIGVILNIFKSCMTPKMKNRVRVHSNGLDSLHQVISTDILPPEYGGNGESLEELISFWNDKLSSYRDWFLDDEKYKAD